MKINIFRLAKNIEKNHKTAGELLKTERKCQNQKEKNGQNHEQSQNN